ncbi:uncharacterized protein HD556DRAFT_1294003, partial [Suillus plorans]
MSDTLEHILEVLRESTIAGEHGKDDKSKKISNEYDDDFLNRAQGDIFVILTFAGLLSTVIATFVIGMQPNPADTTNALLVQLIAITVNGSSAAHDISNLSSSMGYSSSTVWIHLYLPALQLQFYFVKKSAAEHSFWRRHSPQVLSVHLDPT